MAHPEEPTLPEDTGQRKNKNINNALHDIGPFVVGMVFSEDPLLVIPAATEVLSLWPLERALYTIAIRA